MAFFIIWVYNDGMRGSWENLAHSPESNKVVAVVEDGANNGVPAGCALKKCHPRLPPVENELSEKGLGLRQTPNWPFLNESIILGIIKMWPIYIDGNCQATGGDIKKKPRNQK